MNFTYRELLILDAVLSKQWTISPYCSYVREELAIVQDKVRQLHRTHKDKENCTIEDIFKLFDHGEGKK